MKQELGPKYIPSEKNIAAAARRVYEWWADRLTWVTLEDVEQELRVEAFRKPGYSIHTLAQHLEKRYATMSMHTQPVEPVADLDVEEEAYRSTFWGDVLRALKIDRLPRNRKIEPAVREVMLLRGHFCYNMPHRLSDPVEATPSRSHQVFHEAIDLLKEEKRIEMLRDYDE